MNVLIDANIIIDALQARKPWNKAAEEIFLLAAGEKFNGYITKNLLLTYIIFVIISYITINLPDKSWQSFF